MKSKILFYFIFNLGLFSILFFYLYSINKEVKNIKNNIQNKPTITCLQNKTIDNKLKEMQQRIRKESIDNKLKKMQLRIKEDSYDSLDSKLKEIQNQIINKKEYTIIGEYINKIDKNNLIRYMFNNLNKKDLDKLNNSLYIIYLDINSKVNLKNVLNLKSSTAAKRIVIDSTIHYVLTKNKSNLFNDKQSDIENILTRAILLSVIAERETGYFNYEKVIFSPTQAFGTFQINGNTLGINFKEILDKLNINFEYLEKLPLNSLNKKILLDLLNDKKYNDLLTKFYKTKNKNIKRKLRLKILKKENKLYKKMSFFLYEKSKKYEKNVSKKDIRNFEKLLKRTIYGIEINEPKYFKDLKDPFNKRLLYIKLSSLLILSSIEHQGVYSLIVSETKYKYIQKRKYYKNLKLSLTMNKNKFKKIIKEIAKYYNGSEYKNIYAKRASNHASENLYEIKKGLKKINELNRNNFK